MAVSVVADLIFISALICKADAVVFTWINLSCTMSTSQPATIFKVKQTRAGMFFRQNLLMPM